MFRLIWMLVLAELLTAGGCERRPADQMPGKVTPEDVRRDAGQAAETAVEYSRQTKEEFQRKLEARLGELDVQIAKLRDKGRDLTDQAKADWNRKMADLEKKRDAAHVKLAEVRESSAKAWKDIQQGAESAWDELDKAFRDAAREF